MDGGFRDRFSYDVIRFVENRLGRRIGRANRQVERRELNAMLQKNGSDGESCVVGQQALHNNLQGFSRIACTAVQRSQSQEPGCSTKFDDSGIVLMETRGRLPCVVVSSRT